MLCVVVAARLYGVPLNVEVMLPREATIEQLREAVERTFSIESTIRRGNNPEQPFRAVAFAVQDRSLGGTWVNLVCSRQLIPFVQLYAFQPHESRLDDSFSKDLPRSTPLNRSVLRADMEQWNAVRCRLDCVIAAHEEKMKLLQAHNVNKEF
eukprot:PhF_6_TR27317/c0_g1_i2/m.40128